MNIENIDTNSEDVDLTSIITENRRVMMKTFRVASIALDFAETVLTKVHRREGPVALPAPEAKMVELALDAFRAACASTTRNHVYAHDISHDINVVVSQEVVDDETDEN